MYFPMFLLSASGVSSEQLLQGVRLDLSCTCILVNTAHIFVGHVSELLGLDYECMQFGSFLGS